MAQQQSAVQLRMQEKIYYTSNDISKNVTENLKAVVTDGSNTTTVNIKISVTVSELHILVIKPSIISVENYW